MRLKPFASAPKSRAPRHADLARAALEALEPRQLMSGGTDRLVNNNNGATGTAFFTQSETSIIAWGNNVVIGFNDSGANNDGGTGPGGEDLGSAAFTGWGFSSDGGNTFTDPGDLPTHNAGDPVLARDAVSGRVYFCTLGWNTSLIQVFRSDTNGSTFTPAVVGTPGGSSEDKQWMAVDNFAGVGQGNNYLISRRFGGSPGIYMHRSTNQGASFTAGQQLWSGGQGAFVAVGPNHEVYAFSLQGTAIQMRKSIDQGVSFAGAVTIATGQGGGVNGDLGLTGIRNGGAGGNFRSNGFPHAVIHPTTGQLFVTYASNPAGADRGQINLITSSNGGTTWTTPSLVNDDGTGRDQWQPTIAITPDGSKLGVFYYSRQEDAANNNFRYYGRIGDIAGGVVTFAPSEAISDVASQPEYGRDGVVNGVYMGDYDHAAATNDAFHVVWSDSRSALPGGGNTRDPNVYYDKISIAALPVVTASAFAFETGHTVSFTFNVDINPASLAVGDLQLVDDDTNTGVPTPGGSSVSYNAGTRTATFTLSPLLARGNYEAILPAGSVNDTNGNPLGTSAQAKLEFFVTPGDANRDRTVNLADFAILRANFGQSGRVFSQGDFDYNGTVNLNDFAILRTFFGTTLNAPTPDDMFGGGNGGDDGDEGNSVL